MRWIDRLIRLFRKFSENKSLPKSSLEKISLQSLTLWVDSERQKIIDGAKLDSEIASLKNKISDKRWYLEAKLDEWQKKIPFVKKIEVVPILNSTRKFLNLLVIPDDFGKAVQLNSYIGKKVDEILEQLEQSDFAYDFSFILDDIEKSQQVVNPLFKELLDIVGLQKSFEDKINKSGFPLLEKLKKKAISLHESKKSLQEISTRISDLENRLKKVKEIKEEKEHFLLELKKNPSYHLIVESENKRKEVLIRKEECDNEIIDLFSKLKSILVQYEKINQDSLLSLYIEDPILAFSRDHSLSISHSLQHIKALMSAEKLEFEEEQLTYLKEIMDKFSSGYIENLYQKKLSVDKDTNLLVEVKDDDFKIKIDEANYRFNHFLEKFNLLQDESEKLEEESEKKSEFLDREKQMFQDLVHLGLQINIEISES